MAFIFIYKTKIGYEIRISGSNSLFSTYSGIQTSRIIVISQIIGCAIAGFGGGIEVLGSYNAFSWDGTTGYGFDGMVVAIIARRNPLFVIIAALLLGYLRAGADIMNRTSDVALEVIAIVQALMIILVSADAFLSRFKHRLTIKQYDLKQQEAKII